MTSLLKVLGIICVSFSLVECDPTRSLFIPCVKGDRTCYKISSHLIYQDLVKDSDTIKHKEISGKYQKYVYNWTSVTSTGLKNCLVNSIKFNWEKYLEVELLCLNLTFSGKYAVHGEIGGRKVKDAGNFVDRTYTYLLQAVGKVVQVRGKNGKKHLKFVNVVTHSTALGKIRVNVDGSCELEKFINSIWRLASKVVDESFMDAIIKYLVGRANEFFKRIAVDDLFIKNLDLFLSVPDKRLKCRKGHSTVTSLKVKEKVKEDSTIKIEETKKNEREISVSAQKEDSWGHFGQK